MSIFCASQFIRHTIFGLVLYTFFVVSPLHAETTSCTAINSLPYIINTQGVYCFTGHLSTSITSGSAITINTNNVTIDLNGFKLGGLAAGPSTNAYGIYADQRKNITILNGTIRGFNRGIFFNDSSPYTTSQGHVVTDILADQNTRAGIWVYGRGITLRRNRVVDTGGTTFNSSVLGIVVLGPGNNILDNQISTATSTNTNNVIGLYLFDADNSTLQNNRLSDIVASGTGISQGIWIGSSSNVTIRNSTISVADNGITYTSSSGKYMGNLTNSVTTPFTGGTAVGTNN